MNTVQLIGRIARDIDLRYSTSGTAVARFSVAVDRPTKDGQDRTADFPNVVAFGKTAETIEKYFAKGTRIGLTGRLQTGSYQDKDGRTIYTTDVVVTGFDFCETRRENRAAEDERKADSMDAYRKPEGPKENRITAQGGRNRTRRIQKLAEPETLPTFEEIDADVPF